MLARRNCSTRSDSVMTEWQKQRSERNTRLESLSKPPGQCIEAHKRAGEGGERVVDVEPAFVADREASKLVEPCEGSLDDPAVAAKLLAGVDPSAGDARPDLAAATCVAAAAMVIRLVRVQLVRAPSGSAALARDRRDGIDQRLEGRAVVDVGAGQEKPQRNAAPVRDQMALGAGSASIRRVRPGGRTPFFAAMDELSTQARLQSIRSASCNRRSNSRCNRSHTPAACQSRNRRQQVMPDPHPISAGSISQGMPVRSTNKMPVRAALAVTGGRPPFGFAAGHGSNGSMINHSESGTRGLGIPPHESAPTRVQGF